MIKIDALKKYANSLFKILKGEESLKKYRTVFVLIVILSLLLEVFVFNFRSIESIFNKELTGLNYDITNATKISDGVYKATDSTVEIEIDDINAKMNNVCLDIKRADDKAYTKVRLWAVDVANATGITAPEREVVAGLKQTNYIRTHFSGEIKTLKISLLDMKKDEEFAIENLRLNCRVPLCFSIVRFLFVIGILMLLYTFRPKSFVYKHTLDLKKNWQKGVIIAFVITQIIFLWGLCNLNPPYKNPTCQYHELTDALLSGHTYLDKEPSKELMEMENPYDTYLRRKAGVTFEWDHAYYDGHYYVYFGLVPELVFYLPYKILMGENFPNYIAIFINCALMSIAVLCLLNAMVKKWFKNTSFGIFFIISVLVCDTCGIMYIAKRPDFYSIPIAMAMMLAIAGLAFWISAEKYDEMGNMYLKTSYLAWGSVCMALVSGCRPHILITTFFGVILFWNAVFKERALFSKKSIKNTLAICLPYVIIGAVIMTYNFVRFRSPFDFGAAYNLTTNDVTHRGIVMDRNITGIFYYLLQPLTVTNMFPYVQMVNVQSLYQGLTISERMAGGFLWLSPITIMGIRGLWKKKWYDKADIRPYIIACAALAMGVIIIVIDSQVAGILTRYYSDFSWMLLLGAAIAVLAEYNYMQSDKEKQTLIKIVLVCFIISFVVFGLNIFNDVDNSVSKYNPKFFYQMKYLIGFWS